jgi:hypothetical protein
MAARGLRRDGEMERSNGRESEAREESGDSRRARCGRVWEVDEMDGIVEEGSSEFEESEGGTAESSEGGAVGVGEDLEEEFGGESGVIRGRCRCRGKKR